MTRTKSSHTYPRKMIPMRATLDSSGESRAPEISTSANTNPVEPTGSTMATLVLNKQRADELCDVGLTYKNQHFEESSLRCTPRQEHADGDERLDKCAEAARSSGLDWSMNQSAMRNSNLQDMTPMERFLADTDKARDGRSFPKDPNHTAN
ncbi:MAG: hypothetical protein MMC33_009358 [Icmadophila ericetorum]|nr:hypothetical protein [Icmadophila ericetorum]